MYSGFLLGSYIVVDRVAWIAVGFKDYDTRKTIVMTNKKLPHKVKMQYVLFRLHTNYFLLPWEIPEEISRRSGLFNNYRQYLPYQTYMYVHTTFYHGSGFA